MKRRTVKPQGFKNEAPINRVERLMALAMMQGDAAEALRLHNKWQEMLAPAEPYLACPVSMSAICEEE